MVSILTPENEFCENPILKDTIRAIDSTAYNLEGGPKDSLDQDTPENVFCENPILKDTITAVDSTVYNPEGETQRFAGPGQPELL
jgi:hypothetical protein